MEYPIKLPKDQKRLIMASALPTTIKCPVCEETIHFEHPPEKDYYHCKKKMIKWI